MAVKPFSEEELNFFKFASIVHDEFPKMLRSTFVALWDSKIAPLPGYQVWDDTPAVRMCLLALEGGTTVIPTNDSFKMWDCTALFKATIYSKTFAISTTTTIKTLSDQFLRGKKPSPFHISLISPTGNQDETITLAIDQVRLLRNKFCHLPKLSMTKPIFDDYTELAKDAFSAVGLLTDQIDYISCLKQSDFPTERVDELRREIRSIELEHRKFLEEKLMTAMDDRWEMQMFFNEYFSQNLEEIKKCIVDFQTTKIECAVKQGIRGLAAHSGVVGVISGGLAISGGSIISGGGIISGGNIISAGGIISGGSIISAGGIITFGITARKLRVLKDIGIDTISLGDFFNACEKTLQHAVKRGFKDEKDDQKLGAIKQGCLLVPRHYLTDERFLEVWDDFESGRLKESLLEAFSQIGVDIEGLEIEIKNIEEVKKRKDDIKRRLKKSTTHLEEVEYHSLKSSDGEEFEKVFIADANRKDTEEVTMLLDAVTKGTLEMVKYLVEQGADVNGKDTDGRTVLHAAVSGGKMEMVKYLVQQGADVNDRDSNGWTVLHAAVTDSTLGMVKYLIEHGADVNSKNTDGSTVLHAAVDNGALEIVECLVEHGANVTVKGKIDGNTLAIEILKMAIIGNSVVMVNFLVKKNIAVWRAGTFLVEGRQMSFLEGCIHLGHYDIASILKRSVNHREKIERLKVMNHNQLEFKKAGIPIQAFVAKNMFKIGDGGFSSVYVGLMKDGTEVAVKRILVQREDQTIENEREIISFIKTDHSPFIVNYRHFHRDDIFMYLIVDLCEESLREFVDSCSIEHLQKRGPRMIKEILSGLEFLHGERILHRDLKPSNVLVDVEGRMKLGDFGISRVLNDDETTVETFAKGTPGWMPPEVIKAIDINQKGRFKKKSDVHVAGMISFFILTKGEHPFGSSLDRMRNILEGSPVNLKKLCDRNARRFVSWLINRRLDDRPYAHEALRNSFVNKD